MAEQQSGEDTTGDIGSVMENVFGGSGQVASFADGAKYHLEEAKRGNWAVDEETGTHLINGIKQAQERMDEIRPRLELLRTKPMVGNDAYAQQVAQHMLESVDSDEQSLLPVLDAFSNGLDSLREAVETAIRNYDASDEAATKHFKLFQD